MDTDGLVVTYRDDGDGTGELTVAAAFGGFSGVAAAYFSSDQLLRFAEQLLAFPLRDDHPVELAGGYWSRTADVLEEEHIGIRVLPVGPRGQVAVRTHLATPAGDGPVQDVNVDVLTTYEALRQLSSDLTGLVEGHLQEARVTAERL